MVRFFSSLHPIKDQCSLSEIFKEAAITDWITESFSCSTIQKAKVLHTVTATAASKNEPQRSY